MGKEGDDILIKGSIFHRHPTTLNPYVPKNRASRCMRQKLRELQGELDKFSMEAGDFDTILLGAGRPSQCENAAELSSLSISLDLMDFCRLFYATRAPHILLPKFSSNIRQNRPHSGPQNTT